MDFNLCADCGGFNAADLAIVSGAIVVGFGAGAAVGLLVAHSQRVMKPLFMLVGLAASVTLMFVLYLYPSSPAALLPLAFIGGEALVAHRYWREA